MDKVLILDFGSQYTQLIARRVREFHVYSEIHPYDMEIEKIENFAPQAIILSGGPASVFGENAPQIDKKVFELGIPLLGVCYGMQIMSSVLGGKVVSSEKKEYGRATLEISATTGLFEGLSSKTHVWMSHGDSLLEMPPQFIALAKSDNTPLAAIACPAKKIYGVQFHPEVVHTEEGNQILDNFLFKIAGLKADWNMASYIDSTVTAIQEQVGDKKVLCAVSGGVDSTVAAVLIHKAIGSNIQCIFIDNGVLRKNEAKKVIALFREHFKIPLHFVDASDRFLNKLSGITDPEEKRKIIGNEFIYLFEEESKQFSNIPFLAQGTLYPDVIESVSAKGPSAVIKSHHNVGGLPEDMKFDLVEPLRELFKDEVRVLGEALGISKELTGRQPFPGPGLAVRILGEVTLDRVKILQAADEIIVHEIKAAGLYDSIWQSFGVLLPVRTVGVMGDERTYGNVVVLRAVSSVDGMTADWVDLSHELLSRISNRIINEVAEVNRVAYDISSKPPGTIEWE